MAPRKASAQAMGDLGDPPKKPLSAYFHFLADARPKFTAANPDMKAKEIVKALGAQWSTLDGKEKKKYEKLNLEDKERYEKELDEFVAAGGDPKAKKGKKSEGKTTEKKATKKVKKVESEPEVTDESASD